MSVVRLIIFAVPVEIEHGTFKTWFLIFVL